MTPSKWFIPSFSGDLRLEADGDKATRLEIYKPTPGEKKILDNITTEAVKRGWLKDSVRAERSGFLWRKKKVILTAPIAEVGPVVAKIMRPGPAVLTALSLSDGRVTVTEGTELPAPPYRDPEKPALPAKIEEEKPKEEIVKVEAKPVVAATVKRPTPCCPQCVPGAIEPATEVLLSFLTPDEHESWAKTRSIIVEGGLSGHTYAVAHRRSPLAVRFGRICYDLTEDKVMHFHDWGVPPEEEVLATKLILEHREPWLRNEATALGHDSDIYKNPFGDGMDGVADAIFTQSLGGALAGIAAVRRK